MQIERVKKTTTTTAITNKALRFINLINPSFWMWCFFSIPFSLDPFLSDYKQHNYQQSWWQSIYVLFFLSHLFLRCYGAIFVKADPESVNVTKTFRLNTIITTNISYLLPFRDTLIQTETNRQLAVAIFKIDENKNHRRKRIRVNRAHFFLVWNDLHKFRALSPCARVAHTKNSIAVSRNLATLIDVIASICHFLMSSRLHNSICIITISKQITSNFVLLCICLDQKHLVTEQRIFMLFFYFIVKCVCTIERRKMQIHHQIDVFASISDCVNLNGKFVIVFFVRFVSFHKIPNFKRYFVLSIIFFIWFERLIGQNSKAKYSLRF